MVIRLLHQRQWNGRRLRVEFAKPEQIRRLPSHHVCDQALKRYFSHSNIIRYIINLLSISYSKIEHDQFQAFRDHIQQLQRQSIPDSIFNSTFKDIPKADTLIIEQIGQHLLNNEKFYKYVVTIMIKLGLDVSFTKQNDHLSTILLPPDSDEESELETNITINDLNHSEAPEFEMKRRRRRRKRLKTGFIGDNAESFHPTTTNTKNQITTEIEQIFDTVPISKKLSINLTVNNNSTSIPSSSNSIIEHITTSDGFGSLVKPNSPPRLKSKPSSISDNTFDICLLRPEDLITDQELESNRIPTDKWSEYPVFKNYSMGDHQSHRLYVKNIHRKVLLRDLYRLFARYIHLDNYDHVDKFGIVYMEKGRMRGQAFVTYPEVTQASLALTSTNGFMFHDRPIVVQYGRCSTNIQPESI